MYWRNRAKKEKGVEPVTGTSPTKFFGGNCIVRDSHRKDTNYFRNRQRKGGENG